MAERRGRLRRAWERVRKVFRRPEPPSEPPWRDDEPSLVPVGPPRRPRPGAAAVLEPPAEPDALEYPIETDAVGRPVDDDEDEGALRASG